MSSSIALEDFIPEYPDDMDPEFIHAVATKKEFYDLKLPREEESPSSGELLLSQQFMARFISDKTPYRKMLLMHGLGSGKCILPDTKVYTDKGIFTAQDLFVKCASKLIVPSEEPAAFWCPPTTAVNIWARNPASGKLVKAPITYYYTQYVNEEIVQLTLENGSSLRLTKEHHLFNGREWTNHFQVGDSIATAERLEASASLTFSSIVNIDHEMYEGWVYDFEVAHYHCYIAENILCHNTCLSSAVVENFKKSTVGGQKRRPALVFVKNEVLKQNYINEVVNRCTQDVYVFRAEEKEADKGKSFTEEQRRRRIENEVKKTYEIVTFQTFLKTLPSDRVIKERYSNRVIIIDESHNFRIQAGAKDDVPSDEQEDEEGVAADSGVDPETYNKMHHFLHTVENCPILLLTGTPIWDRTNEIASQMNLILELDNQLPTGKNFDREYFNEDGTISPEKQLELKEHFKGRISYLRSATTTAERKEMGAITPWLKYITIYPDGMSELQSLAVEEARKRDTSFLRISRDASIFVFPVFDSAGDVTNVAYGKAEFNKRVVQKKKVVKMKRPAKGKEPQRVEEFVETFKLDPRLKKELVENLADYSAIFASIVKQIQDHPNENVFIYDEFVRGGGGVIMLGLILEAYGFVRANKASDIAKPRSDGRKRFAMITANDYTINKRRDIIELLESASRPDNLHGERLQVIIGSKKIAEGVNMKGFRQVHVVVPPWNIPSIDQPLYRVFRFGSHRAFAPSERYVKIFRHVAVERSPDEEGYDQGDGYPPDSSFADAETVGVHVYSIAEEKEFRNTQIYRLIKEAAVDCAINYKRNVVAEDVSGTRECDFKEQCNYECDGFPPSSTKGKVWSYDVPPEEIDYTTYNLFYSKGRRKQIIEEIIRLYGAYFALELHQIQDLLSVIDREKFILLQALDTIINARILIKNRYGFGSYLKEEGNMYFLDNNISSSSSYAEVTYIRQPLVTERTSLQDLIENLELTKDEVNVQEYCNDPTPENLERLSFRTKIIMVEAAYKFRLEHGDDVTSQQALATNLLLEEFGDSIYTLKDGTVAHVLYTEEYKGLGYNVAAREIKATGLTRYYDTEDGVWKYVTDSEKEEKYVEEIRTQYTKTKRTFDGNEYGIYGYVAKDKKFRIVLASGSEARGKVCSSIKVPQLVSIFIDRLGFYPEPKENISEMSRAEVIRGIRGRPGYSSYKEFLDEKSDDELKGLLTLLSMQQDELCVELKLWLINNDLLDT